MSRYSTPPLVSTPPIVELCWHCGQPVGTDGDIQPVHCPACRRMAADLSIHDAMIALRGLRRGNPPFDVLSESERRAELESLMNDGAPDPVERRGIEDEDEDYHRALTLRREREAAEQEDTSRVIYEP